MLRRLHFQIRWYVTFLSKLANDSVRAVCTLLRYFYVGFFFSFVVLIFCMWNTGEKKWTTERKRKRKRTKLWNIWHTRFCLFFFWWWWRMFFHHFPRQWSKRNGIKKQHHFFQCKVYTVIWFDDSWLNREKYKTSIFTKKDNTTTTSDYSLWILNGTKRNIINYFGIEN